MFVFEDLSASRASIQHLQRPRHGWMELSRVSWKAPTLPRLLGSDARKKPLLLVLSLDCSLLLATRACRSWVLSTFFVFNLHSLLKGKTWSARARETTRMFPATIGLEGTARGTKASWIREVASTDECVCVERRCGSTRGAESAFVVVCDCLIDSGRGAVSESMC